MEIVSAAVAVIVCRGNGDGTEVLLMRRASGVLRGEWCQLTGRVEAGESAWEAAARELREETGISEFDLFTAGYCDSFYDVAANSIQILPMFVVWIDERQVVRVNEENTEHSWVRAKDAEKRLPFAGHRIALREVITDFVDNPAKKWRLIKRFLEKET